MSYRLGIDLGTTWTAAAVARGTEARIFQLGEHRAAMPSVVLMRRDGTVLTGDAAVRRAMAEPERVVREFKRRIGDPTPIVVAGGSYSAESLTGRLLETVLEVVAAREGGPPSEVALAHPAPWGRYKLSSFASAIRLAGLDPGSCRLMAEPVAAAITYAVSQRVAVGEHVCVYDLGGGTFDVAVARRTDTGFDIVGRPDGIDRLGGIDVDDAVFTHVRAALGPHYDQLDPSDPATLTAIARLRQDCTEAKEALSADTDTVIPVALPRHQTEVRLTRAELERFVRPRLLETIEVTRRAIASADLEPETVGRVLLVGGSSRIPLVAQLVVSELGIPTAVDAHPKHAIAIGTAIHEVPAAAPGRPAPEGPTIHVPRLRSPLDAAGPWPAPRGAPSGLASSAPPTMAENPVAPGNPPPARPTPPAPPTMAETSVAPDPNRPMPPPPPGARRPPPSGAPPLGSETAVLGPDRPPVATSRPGMVSSRSSTPGRPSGPGAAGPATRTTVLPPGTVDPGRPSPHAVSTPVMVALVLLVLLMIGFGAFLLLRPPSDPEAGCALDSNTCTISSWTGPAVASLPTTPERPGVGWSPASQPAGLPAAAT
ncbi:MAG: Hsp70 family protein [Acidimicrobiales bacterium]